MSTSENQNPADSRKHPRVEIPDQVAVKNTNSGDTVGQLVNLSIDGLMIMGSNCVPPGTVLQLQIPLGSESGSTALNIGVECLWCQDANDSGSFWSGFQIIDIAPEEQKMLDSLLGD